MSMTLLKRCSALAAAALLLSTLGCGSTSNRESTGEYVDDTAITTKVKSAIFNEPSLKVLKINVETYKSVVQLSGFADTRADMDKATDLARAVPGVRSVKNDMRVK
jgi:osmotically-inducible protein OsmY